MRRTDAVGPRDRSAIEPAIRFYSVGAEYGELSNFALYPIALKGKRWPTSEHYFQAQKVIETRDQVQASAMEAVTHYLTSYEVETRGVYIQDVVFPEQLVVVLTQREIAKQEKATFHEQREAQNARIEVEKARGTADMQGQLATSQVSIEINSNAADEAERFGPKTPDGRRSS
jgi:regulator of protease activity HflC (stomatin/prohibitin superfamily)